MPADYLYGDRRAPYLQAGLWGILRVRPACAANDLRPLVASGQSCPPRVDGPTPLAAGVLLALGLATLLIRRSIRRASPRSALPFVIRERAAHAAREGEWP